MKKRNDIILYHFCAAHMVDQIMQEGLTLGCSPVYDGDKTSYFFPCQWLTTEANPNKQSWATRNMISYSRTAYRLTIRIPGSRQKKLQRAIDFVKTLPSDSLHLVEGWEGSDKWYVFLGKIPPSWIIGCKRMEDEKQ